MTLVAPVATAKERHVRRPILLLRVTTDEGVGYGECDALETTRYAGESIDTAEVTLAQSIIPDLLKRGAEYSSLEEAVGSLSTQGAAPMATSAIEMALMDAALRARGRSLATYLEVSRVAIPAGATVGIGPVRDVLAAVNDVVASGIRRIKLKIAPDVDVVAVRTIRDHCPDVEIVVDANGSYTISDPSHRAALRALDDFGLSAIEQPLSAEDLDGHAQLVKELRTRILLDESIANLDRLDRVLDAGACTAVCVKPARLGGIFAARKARDRCLAAGVPCAIGGLFEAGLGRAAAIAVGALDGFDVAGDLGPSSRYFRDDITTPHKLFQGMLPVPMRPGLGVDVRQDIVDALTARSHQFLPS